MSGACVLQSARAASSIAARPSSALELCASAAHLGAPDARGGRACACAAMDSPRPRTPAFAPPVWHPAAAAPHAAGRRVARRVCARKRVRVRLRPPAVVAVADDPGLLAWVFSGVGSATAAVWAVVAQKTHDVLPGAREADREEHRTPGRSGEADEEVVGKDGGELVRGRNGVVVDGGKTRAGMAGARRVDGNATARGTVYEEADDEGEVDDDGLAERLAAKEVGRRKAVANGMLGSFGFKVSDAEKEKKGDSGAKDGLEEKKVKGGAAQSDRDPVESEKGKSGGFFFLGRRSSDKVVKNSKKKERRKIGSKVTYGGLTQGRVTILVNEALRGRREEPLATLLPYHLQRQLFSDLRNPECTAERKKLQEGIKKSGPGLSSTVSISRDALRKVESGVSDEKSAERLDRIQRDMESVSSKSQARGGKTGKLKGKARDSDRASQSSKKNGWLWFLSGKGSDVAEASRDSEEMPEGASFIQLETRPKVEAVVQQKNEVSSAKRKRGAMQTGRDRMGTSAPSAVETPPTRRSRLSRQSTVGQSSMQSTPSPSSPGASGVLDIPLGMVGDLLKAVWSVREDETSPNRGDRVPRSDSTVAYAAAMTRDASAMEEIEGSTGGTAASAFAAASVLASSTHDRELDAIEAAGLQASVTAARAVTSVEDAEIFVETVGVGALVVAVRVLHGQARSSALTALANIAIMLPKSRENMLLCDGGSLVQCVSQILHDSEGLNPVSHVVARKTTLIRMEALVSGTHLLGSLALATSPVGAENRTRMASDEDLVAVLKKLAGGAKAGEPEGAARAARRALGAFGINSWTPRMPGQRGLRILSIDGGGTRAIMAFEMLKHLEHLTGCRISDMFDVIGGTSTGAIVAASLGIAHKSVEEVEALYRRLIGNIFAKHPVNGPKMLLTRAYYDTKVLESSLKLECGTGVFIDSLAEERMNKVFVISSIMSRSPQELHVFRNYTFPTGHESRYDGTTEAQLWEALRASSAAPTFFSEILVNGELHADGAIVANNPTAVALHETKCMFPGVPIECVVSMGNGLSVTADGVGGDGKTLSDGKKLKESSGADEKAKVVGWGDVVGSIVASATSTETVHHALSDLFPKSKYFRFNPLTRSTEIDETRPDKLAEFVEEARKHIDENGDRFAEVAQTLRPKTNQSLWQRFQDSLLEELSVLSVVEEDVYLP